MDVVKIMEENAVALKWQKGDVVWIDNNQVLHSRRSGYKSPRKILAVLAANCPYASS